MVFNATFNNISVISWRSVLLVEKLEYPGRKPPTCCKSLTNCSSKDKKIEDTGDSEKITLVHSN